MKKRLLKLEGHYFQLCRLVTKHTFAELALCFFLGAEEEEHHLV